MGLERGTENVLATQPMRKPEKIEAPPELIEQIKRLRGYYKWAEFADEALRSLWTHAHNYEHAERIVTYILDKRNPDEKGFLTCPSPAEMKEYCEMVPVDPVPKPAPSKKCPHCYGTGFEVGVITGPSGEYSAARKCRCRA